MTSGLLQPSEDKAEGTSVSRHALWFKHMGLHLPSLLEEEVIRADLREEMPDQEGVRVGPAVPGRSSNPLAWPLKQRMVPQGSAGWEEVEQMNCCCHFSQIPPTASR